MMYGLYAGKILRKHREQVAELLGVDPHTVGSWERGERPLRNIDELLRIAETLEIDPGEFGISIPITWKTPEQIDSSIDQIWTLMKQTRNDEAWIAATTLIRDLDQAAREDTKLLPFLARAWHVSAHIASITSRTTKIEKAIQRYREVEHIARIIEDDTLITIALTYQGDMFRRKGDIDKAITYLEAARDTTPQADNSARGNAIQLLGRSYFHKGDLNGFEWAMEEAMNIAYTITPGTNSTHGFYTPGTVYEEYGRSYAYLGQMEKALTNIAQAENNLPDVAVWRLMTATSRAQALVRGGEITEGTRLAIETANQCLATGNLRFIERLYAIQRYLDSLSRDIGKKSLALREVLDGPIEQ
jgi:tetratricopeptide (TPR) repeat protein